MAEAAPSMPSTATPTFVESPTPDPDEQYEENAGGYQGKPDTTGGGVTGGVVAQPVVTAVPSNEEQKPTYLADWGAEGVTLRSEYDKGKYSPAELARDRNAWAKANGKEPVDIVDLVTMAQDTDLNKSKDISAAEEKKLKNQEKWERFGNFFLHLGNFVGAIAGAPSQTYESVHELTKRQQLLRDRTNAARQAANKAYIDQLMKGGLNDANIKLANNRAQEVLNEGKRKDDLNAANVNKANAQADQATAAAGLSKSRQQTEDELRPERKKTEQARQGSYRASSTVRYSQAQLNNARKKEVDKRTDEDNTALYESYRYDHPDEFEKAFEKEGGLDANGEPKQAGKEFKKNVVKNVEKQLKKKKTGNDYSQYIVK